MASLTLIFTRLNLERTLPNGLVGCKVPTDLVKISLKEATHMGFYYKTKPRPLRQSQQRTQLICIPAIVNMMMNYNEWGLV